MMSSIKWIAEILSSQTSSPLPKSFPPDLLIGLTRNIEFYKAGLLSEDAAHDLKQVMKLWISQILDAQSSDRSAVFKKDLGLYFIPMVADLSYVLQQEITSRSIDFEIYELDIDDVFEEERMRVWANHYGLNLPEQKLQKSTTNRK
jgi:hypothetical protein